MKVKTSSSSFVSLSKKVGGQPGPADSESLGGASCQLGEGSSIWSPHLGKALRTWTNSIGVFSPRERDTDARVAGNALGTMLIEVRFRGLEMTSEEMDTVR